MFAPCYGSWFVSNLVSGVNYVFSVIATDAVQNVGNVVIYTWRIGRLRDSQYATVTRTEASTPGVHGMYSS